MIVVAANRGMATHPAWYLNLVARPQAVVEVDDRRMTVSAVELGGG